MTQCPFLCAYCIYNDSPSCSPLCQVLAGDSRQDDFCVNGLFIHLRAERERVGHQVVDQARVPVGMAVYGTERGTVYGNGDTGACGAHSGKAEETDRGRICRACVPAC